jgi:hypothetical protein
MTHDEAQRIAANITKLPELSGKMNSGDTKAAPVRNTLHSTSFAVALTKAKYAEHADAIAAIAAIITEASMQRPYQRACSAARRGNDAPHRALARSAR